MSEKRSREGCGMVIAVSSGGFLLSIVALYLLDWSTNTFGGSGWILAPRFLIIDVGHADVIEPIVAILINTALYSLLIYGAVMLWKILTRNK